MRECLTFYIDGCWVDPVDLRVLDVGNPATETVCGRIAVGESAAVDHAVQVARRAFPVWSQTTREERLDPVQAVPAQYQRSSRDREWGEFGFHGYLETTGIVGYATKAG